jgi:hypothetical protein
VTQTPDANPENDATLDDVLPLTEQVIPDHHEHGKMPRHPNDDALAHRTEQERVELGIDDYDPDDIPPATD